MDKLRKLELIQRSLGIRHKLKVHESMKAPDNHEEVALMLISRWELEDELQAIEEILQESRRANIQGKKIALASGVSCASMKRKEVTYPALRRNPSSRGTQRTASHDGRPVLEKIRDSIKPV